jgi:hypothetical protein
MTLSRKLTRHLKILVLKSFDKEYKYFSTEKTTKKSILEGNAPLYTMRESQCSMTSFGESFNALFPIMREEWPFLSESLDC